MSSSSSACNLSEADSILNRAETAGNFPNERGQAQRNATDKSLVDTMNEDKDDKGKETASIVNDSDTGIGKVVTDLNEEDHIDGLLSPTSQLSFLDKEDHSTPLMTAVVASDREVHEEAQGNINRLAYKSVMSNKGDNRNSSENNMKTHSNNLSPGDLTRQDPASLPLPLSPPSTPSANANPSPSPATSTFSAENPLPASRYPIPHRRPKGWITSLNHPRAVSNFPPDRDQIPLTPPRSSSTSDLPPSHSRNRVTSVQVHQQPYQGRRVSGAMQYAFHPTIHNQLSQAQDEQSTGQDQSDLPGVEGDSDEESIGIETLSLEEETRIRYEVGLSQDQDEVWMSYVRNQLSALFPDFFEMNPGSLNPPLPPRTDHGQVSTMDDIFPSANDNSSLRPNTPGENGLRHFDDAPSQDYSSPNNGGGEEEDLFSPTANRSFTTADTSSLATPPLQSNAAMLRGNVIVPNVRDEISGLREEIERLRDVVGGLAQGLGGNQNQPVNVDEVDNTASQVEETTDDDQESAREQDMSDQGAGSRRQLVLSEETKDERQLISEAFKRTAGISVEIIRILDRQYHDTSHDGTQPHTVHREDDEVFSASNLLVILDYVISMSSRY
ncbi:uncharacterized protein IL334_006819 [Kwoniella shivajii]|uniref:Uncharacterized protein n=1 Tax=Kwoniella shivajii TaxID=564305 RepID=A0ABZ1D7D9_9TREE|nr:hypothetical protein IL334_006819 [Kwoniella shivajii]